MSDSHIPDGHSGSVRRPVAYKNEAFLDSDDARILRIASEYLHPLTHFRDENIHDTVVFFGSARITDEGPLARYYKEARELARMVTEWSDHLPDDTRRFVVCTGGGPGIMEAANRGAQDANGKTIGLNIGLPFEQWPNRYITPELSFEFKYFFMRKFWFAYLAKALVVFPGGYGTLDEMAEILTLAQTRKLENKIIILLYGTSYWREVINFDALIKYGTISPEDLNLFSFVDSPAEAFELLQQGLTKYYLEPEKPLIDTGPTPSLAKSRI
jgi:uncharacterized protein (TIGR00730 family)